MNDRIIVENLELQAHIGITSGERANAQRLTVSLILHPLREFSALDDRIENTVDYAKVCEAVRLLASLRPRNLIETLAEEIARLILSDFSVRAVDIDLRKYVLPETAWVGVNIQREAAR